MHISAIKNNDDYLEAIKIAEKLEKFPVGSKESRELQIISIMIEDYESKNYRLELFHHA